MAVRLVLFEKEEVQDLYGSETISLRLDKNGLHLPMTSAIGSCMTKTSSLSVLLPIFETMSRVRWKSKRTRSPLSS